MQPTPQTSELKSQVWFTLVKVKQFSFELDAFVQVPPFTPITIHPYFFIDNKLQLLTFESKFARLP